MVGLEKKTADIFVKIYAVLFWIGALFGAIGGIAMLFGGSLMGGAMGSMMGYGAVSGLFGGLFVVLAIILLALAVLEFFVGLHLWQHRNWARIAAIVFSCLGVLSIFSLNILGLIIGGFGLYLFAFDDGAKSLFA